MKPLEERKTIADYFQDGYEPSKRQVEFAQTHLNYRKAGIDVEALEQDKYGFDTKVKITQKRLLNGYVLNQKQLVERAKSLYKILGNDIKVIPVVWSLDTSEINIEWISERMEEFGIKRNDLVSHLAMDKPQLSRIFSGGTNLSHSTKAKFFWYFMVYELNRDLRAQLS